MKYACGEFAMGTTPQALRASSPDKGSHGLVALNLMTLRQRQTGSRQQQNDMEAIAYGFHVVFVIFLPDSLLSGNMGFLRANGP